MSKENRLAVQIIDKGTMSKGLSIARLNGILFFIISAIWLINCEGAQAYTVHTKYTTLVFQSAEDVRRFNSAIDFSTGSSIGGFFSSASDSEVKNELIVKIDALFVKVQRILDMRKKMDKVRVNIYSDRDELHKAYYQMFKKECTVRGWYFFDRHTIYLNVEDVHEGMLAHELAHAIIDKFLSVRPPRASAEILARYVDENLFEQVKTY